MDGGNAIGWHTAGSKVATTIHNPQKLLRDGLRVCCMVCGAGVVVGGVVIAGGCLQVGWLLTVVMGQWQQAATGGHAQQRFQLWVLGCAQGCLCKGEALAQLLQPLCRWDTFSLAGWLAGWLILCCCS